MESLIRGEMNTVQTIGRFLVAITLAAGLEATVLPAGADAFTISTPIGPLSASATFDVSGSNLMITLTNTGTADVTGASGLLTALFFDIAGNPTLTPMSAMLTNYGLAGGSTVQTLLENGTVQNGPDGGGNVGGEWAYLSGLSGAPGGATQGISSAGFSGIGFGTANFNGPNLEGPADGAVDGPQYGIAPAIAASPGDPGDNPYTYGGRETPLIHNSVVFTLGDYNGGAISNVSFQYGTSLGETSIPAIPEPATLLLLGSGLAGLGALRRGSGQAWWKKPKEVQASST